MLTYVISGLLALAAVALFVVVARRSMTWRPTEDSQSQGYRHQGPYPPAGGGAG